MTRPRSFRVGDSQGRAPKGLDFPLQDTNTPPSSDESALESGSKPGRGISRHREGGKPKDKEYNHRAAMRVYSAVMLSE